MTTGKQPRPVVGILMGSDSDYPVMSEAVKMLNRFGVPFEIEVASAHRSPARVHEYASTAIERGLKAIIIAAGGAAHLGGVVAAVTTLPVIGVPVASTPLGGLDSMLSIAQMPAGIPVATMAIDKAGAANAAIFAAQIVATSDPELRQRLASYKEELARGVAEKNARLQQQIAAGKS